MSSVCDDNERLQLVRRVKIRAYQHGDIIKGARLFDHPFTRVAFPALRLSVVLCYVCSCLCVHGCPMFTQDPPAVESFSYCRRLLRPINIYDMIPDRSIIPGGSDSFPFHVSKGDERLEPYRYDHHDTFGKSIEMSFDSCSFADTPCK